MDSMKSVMSVRAASDAYCMLAAMLPHVYWINLDRSEGRRARMQQRLDERGIRNTRVRAVDGADAAATETIIRSRANSSFNAATIASHLSAMALALDNGLERVLIMEDDTTFEPYDAWPDGYAAIAAELPDDFSAIALCIAELPKNLDALFRRQRLVHRLRRRAYWSAGAYVITRSAIERLLARYRRDGRYDVTGFRGHQHAYEVVMRTLQAEKLPGPYLSRIPLFLFEGHDSEIHADHLDEHCLARDFLREHYLDLIRGSYSSPYALTARLARAWSRLRRARA
jgi:GR25 family glycosyltransferase involved in LPS biosynthesis